MRSLEDQNHDATINNDKYQVAFEQERNLEEY